MAAVFKVVRDPGTTDVVSSEVLEDKVEDVTGAAEVVVTPELVMPELWVVPTTESLLLPEEMTAPLGLP